MHAIAPMAVTVVMVVMVDMTQMAELAGIAEIGEKAVNTLMTITAILAVMDESNFHSQLLNLLSKRQMLTWLGGEGVVKMLTCTDRGEGVEMLVS